MLTESAPVRMVEAPNMMPPGLLIGSVPEVSLSEVPVVTEASPSSEGEDCNAGEPRARRKCTDGVPDVAA